MDIPTVAAGLAGTKAAFDILGRAINLGLDNKTLEIVNEARQKVLQVQGDILEAKRQMLEITSENEELRRQIKAYDDWEKQKAQYRMVTTENRAVVFESVDNSPKHFICPKCYEDRKRIILQARNEYWLSCPDCKNTYSVNQQPPPIIRS
jgi:hypothetical protein